MAIQGLSMFTVSMKRFYIIIRDNVQIYLRMPPMYVSPPQNRKRRFLDKPLTKSKIDINNAHDKYVHIREKALPANLKILGINQTHRNLRNMQRFCFSKGQIKGNSKNKMHQATLPGERLCTDISGPLKSP
jgi:hypothetical protein